MKGIIFVSCGQSSPEERRLGKSISDLISRVTPFDGYFAENESTLAGFVQNILGKIHRSVALVCVMHHRGTVATPNGDKMRGSVWIEQEIAVAAFIEQVLGRKIPVRVYVQSGISREGMREQLLLNAVPFDDNERVLEDFVAFLPEWGTLGLPLSKRSFGVEITYEPRRIESNVHYYVLSVWLENTGEEAIKDFRIDLLFPRRYLTSASHGLEQTQQSTRTHICLRATGETFKKTLYPSDKIQIISLDYFVNSAIFHSDDAFNENITVNFSGEGITPQSLARSMRDFQRF